MREESLAMLNSSLGGAAPRGIEILTAAELDSISAGTFTISREAGDSSCVSQCHVDGNNEPGTS